MAEKQSRIAGLTEEEYQLYLVHEKHGDGVSGLYLTIAASRASEARLKKLLEKHQYRNSGDEFDNDMYCVECFAKIFVPPGTSQSNIKLYTDKIVCKPGCALAAELRGGG